MAADPYSLPQFIPGPRLIDGTDLNNQSAALGISTVVLPISALSGLADAQFRSVGVPFPFQLVSMKVVVDAPATTAAKAATLSATVGGTRVTGGVVALTSANMTPSGNAVAASAVTADNQALVSGSSVGFEVTGTTAFVEGSAHVEFTIKHL